MSDGEKSLNCSEPALFGAVDFRVKTSLWLDKGKALLANEAACGFRFEELLRFFDRHSLSSRMSPVCYRAIKGEISLCSFKGWRNSGIMSLGAVLTLNTSVWPKDANVCSLSQVLETSVAPKYFLSAKACAGILRRAEKRGKTLPEHLARALRAGVGLEPISSAGGGLSKALKAQANCKHREDSETYITGAVTSKWAKGGGPAGDEHYNLVSHTLSSEGADASGRNLETQEEVAYALTNPGSGGRTHSRSIQTNATVRRLTPTECLRLQGFPDDWLDGLGFSDSVKYRAIGNAVAVPVAEWIAGRLKALINP